MKKMVFFAKIIPDRFALTAPEMRYKATIPMLDFSYEAHLSIHVGQVVLQITIPEDLSHDTLTIKNLLEGDIRHFVDYYGFIHGARFDVDMISAADNAGQWSVFGIDIPVLKTTLQGKQDELMRKYFGVAITRPECSIVMADFREAMRNPPHTGFHCYRAIEAIMQTMTDESVGKNSGAWDRLRNSLRIDRPCLDAIKRHADAPRHGKPHSMTDSERAYVFEKTQAIVLRFLEFLTRGEKALPEFEFPLLTA